MLLETFQLNLKSTMSAALLIPFFNFMGVITTRLLITKFQNNETKLVAIFFPEFKYYRLFGSAGYMFFKSVRRFFNHYFCNTVKISHDFFGSRVS